MLDATAIMHNYSRLVIEHVPLTIACRGVVKSGVATEADIADMRTRIAAEIDAAVAFAKESPFPARAELQRDVFPGGAPPQGDAADRGPAQASRPAA